MYVITGATGRTGSIIANKLLQEGKDVNVIGRSAKGLQKFTEQGAFAFEADPSDGPALLSGFKKADAAWIMLQPNYIPDSPDFRKFQSGIVSAVTQAIAQSSIKHIVSLSSWGADRESGSGPVAGLRDMELALNQFPDLNVLHLRAGYFMENMLGYIPQIVKTGRIEGPFDPNIKLPFVSTIDIGNFAASALLDLSFKEKKVLELHGERDLSVSEAVKIISTAIGKPELKYCQITTVAFVNALKKSGISNNVADLMHEVVIGINSGYIKTTQPRSVETTTPTTFEKFVTDSFLPAYELELSGTLLKNN